jgi:uncharacterized protein involved in exopolysaccharide biosynthesis
MPLERESRPNWDLVEVTPLLDLDDLVGIIKRRLPWLIAIPVICVALALSYAFFVATPLYKSSALVFVDPMFDRTLQIQPSGAGMSDLDSLNSLEKAIMSDSMVLRVIDKLNLRKDLSFLPKSLHKSVLAGEEVSGSMLIKEIRKKRFSASLIRPTRLLELSVLDPDPVRAQLIAITFVEEFETFLGDQKRREAGTSSVDLRVRADEAYANALDAEKELEEFRLKNPDLTVEQDHQLFAERLTKIGEELNTVSGKVFNLRSRVETLEEVDPEVDPIKVINIGNFNELEHVSELLNQRIGAHTGLASVAGQFTETHPRYREAQSRVTELDAQLKSLATDLKSSLEADYESAVKNEAMLTQRVGELQSQLTGVKTASSQFRAIQQQVETEWQVHQSLRERIGQTSLEGEKSNDVTRLMSEPIVAHKPSSPSKPIALLAGAFMGGLFCLGLIGTDMLRGGPFRNRRQVEQRLEVPVVAEISTPSRGGNDAELLEAMTGVLLSPEHRDAGLIHLSSLSENEEGLRVAACLASASAYYACPTLLISVAAGGDPRMPVNLVPQASQTENLHTLRLPASFLIAPSEAWQLLSPHRVRFTRIIIESTAFKQESQIPSAVASLADANLVLVQSDSGTRKEVQQRVARLARGTKGSLAVILQA